MALFAARIMRGMSQQEVANVMGVRRPYVSRLESHTTPKLHNFDRFAAALGISTQKLAAIYDFLTEPLTSSKLTPGNG